MEHKKTKQVECKAMSLETQRFHFNSVNLLRKRCLAASVKCMSDEILKAYTWGAVKMQDQPVAKLPILTFCCESGVTTIRSCDSDELGSWQKLSVLWPQLSQKGVSLVESGFPLSTLTPLVFSPSVAAILLVLRDQRCSKQAVPVENLDIDLMQCETEILLPFVILFRCFSKVCVCFLQQIKPGADIACFCGSLVSALDMMLGMKFHLLLDSTDHWGIHQVRSLSLPADLGCCWSLLSRLRPTSRGHSNGLITALVWVSFVHRNEGRKSPVPSSSAMCLRWY